MHDNITAITALVGEVVALVGIITPLLARLSKITKGQLCQLRSEMLSTYYHNRESKTIRQYELENFVLQYEAYKALKGNSFVDKIHSEVMSWEVIT